MIKKILNFNKNIFKKKHVLGNMTSNYLILIYRSLKVMIKNEDDICVRSILRLKKITYSNIKKF